MSNRELVERIKAADPDADWHFSAFDKTELAKFRRKVIKRVRACGVPLSTKNGWVFQWSGKYINAGAPA